MFRPSKTERAVFEVIGEPVSPTEVARALGKKKNAAWMLLDNMVRRGLLVKVGFGRYWFARPERHGVER